MKRLLLCSCALTLAMLSGCCCKHLHRGYGGGGACSPCNSGYSPAPVYGAYNNQVQPAYQAAAPMGYMQAPVASGGCASCQQSPY